jgi:hypothetical protein
MLITLALSTVLAQSLPDEPGYSAPLVDSDQYRPVLDSPHMLATEDSQVLDGFAASAELGWAHNLLYFEYDDGEVVGLRTEAGVAHVGAAWGMGRLRVGALAPIILWSTSDLDGTHGTALGDLELDIKVRIWVGEFHGLAGYGRVSIPLGASSIQLGRAGPGLEVGAIADLGLRGVHIAVNAGVSGQQRVELYDVSLGTLLVWRAAVSGGLSRGPQLTGELIGRHRPGYFLQPDVGTAVETLGSLHLTLRGVPVRAGLGVGLLGGVGTPAWRLVVGVGHRADGESTPFGDEAP